MCTMVYAAVYFKLNRFALNSGRLIFFFCKHKDYLDDSDSKVPAISEHGSVLECWENLVCTQAEAG